MAKTSVKNKYIGARVDPELNTEVEAYVAALEDFSQGDLIRRSVREYMANHPLKQEGSGVPDHLKLKPGGENNGA